MLATLSLEVFRNEQNDLRTIYEVLNLTYNISKCDMKVFRIEKKS